METLYEIAQQQSAVEERRQTQLDSKAQSLLTAAGLSNTVAFTFGGILLQHPECLWSAGAGLLWSVIVIYGLALICGLLASVTALRALWIRDDYRKMDENDYLHRSELAEADRLADQDGFSGTTRYKRHLIVHLIKLHRAHFDVHEKKARIVRQGQMFFGLFLAGIMLIGAAITGATLGRAGFIQIVRANHESREQQDDHQGHERPRNERMPELSSPRSLSNASADARGVMLGVEAPSMAPLGRALDRLGSVDAR